MPRQAAPGTLAPRAITATEKYQRERAKGGRPRITDAQKKKFFRMIAEGAQVTTAARECGFSLSSGTALMRKHRPQIRKMAGPPDPVPFAGLSDDARRACDDPEFFAKRFLGIDLPAWAVELMSELLAAYLSEDDEYLVVNVHPGSGKSTIVTWVFVAWVVCRERALGREPRIQLGHMAEAKAKWYLARLAKAFTTNLDLIESFGRFAPERRGPGIPWSATQLMVEPLDWSENVQKEPTISAASYDGSVLSGRYTLILWDDLLDKANQTSADQRARVVDTWERDFEGRLDPGGLMALCNARIGPEDLSHYLLEQRDEGDAPVYRRIIFPAHDDSKCTVEPDGRVTHHGDYPTGCILGTRRLAKDGSDERAWRRLQHFMRNERRFALVWNQEDVDPEGFMAERSWFAGGRDSTGYEAPGCFDTSRTFGQLPQRDDPHTVSAISVDPSVDNFWAVSHFVAWADRHYVIQGERRRMRPHELIYRENDGRYTGILPTQVDISIALGVPVTYIIVEERAFTKWLSDYPFVREWAQANVISLVPHDCVDSETEALTQRGWLRYDQIDRGDMLLTLNQTTGRSEWKPVEYVYRGLYDGPMLEWTTHAIDALTTPDHRWPVTDYRHIRPISVVPFSAMNTAHQIPLARPLDEDQDPAQEYTDAFVELVGWAVTEGHFQKRGGGIAIGQSPTRNPEKVERIRLALKRAGAHWREGWNDQYRADRVLVFRLSGAVAQQIRAVTGGRKDLPMPFLLSLPADQRRLLLDVLIAGDGWHGPGRHRAFCSNDETLIRAVEVLSALDGSITRREVREDLALRNPRTKEHKVVHVQTWKHHSPRTGRPHVETVPYRGVVWCPHTENGTFYARRGGRTYFTGNTNRVNKHDLDLGPPGLLTPIYKEARCSIPYLGYTEKLFAEAWAREACSWPEGSTSDLVMHHWFFALKLPQLQVAAAPRERDYEDTTPAWARQAMRPENIPAWAKAGVG